MPVKILAPITTPQMLKKTSPVKTSGPTRKVNPYADLQLPTGPKTPNLNISQYTFLIYGREKIGKTTLLSSFPEAIFAATEPGTKGLSISEFNAEDGGIKNWAIFRKMVELLSQNTGRFKTVIIDTVDRAYDMCLDWVCEHRGIEYPGKDSDGDEDFGKSWRAVKIEFVEQLHLLEQAGYGVVFTSHAKETTIKTRAGDKYTRIQPTMSSQARGVIEAIVDFFFYCEYMRAPDGSTKRILICQGDDTIWAGARSGVINDFPQFLPMEKKNGYSVIHNAFLGKFTGLDAKTLMPARSTMQTAKDFMIKEKTKAALNKVGG